MQLLILTGSCLKSGARKAARSWCYLSHPRCTGCLCATLPSLCGCSSSKAGQRRLVWSYRLSWDSVIPLGPHQVGLSHGQYIHRLQGDLDQPLFAASLASVMLTCFLQSSSRAGSMRYEASGSQCVSCRQREISLTQQQRGKHAVSCRFTPYKTPLTLCRYLQIISSQVNPEVFIA